MKDGAVEGNAVQLPMGFAVLRLQLLFGNIHRAAPAKLMGLCVHNVAPTLLT